MTSLCPKCHHEIEHEDYLFEVACTCGVHFNPFMTTQDSAPHAMAGAMVGAVPAAEVVSSDSIAVETAPLEKDEPRDPKFQESTQAFSAIRTYGETLGVAGQTSATFIRPGLKSRPITSGFDLPGMQISGCVTLLSVRAEVSSGENPLVAVLGKLSVACERAGGDAVVGVAWQILGDSRTVVASGNAVKIKGN